MRVVAGAFRGRRLEAPPGRDTRPTSDRVREALFQVLGPLDGLSVLDLYAGSGALGIEALSRGAGSAVFVESDPRALSAIGRNLEKIGVEAAVHSRDALAFLEGPGAGSFDLVLIDPPYSCAQSLAGRLSDLVPRVTNRDARIVTESNKREPLELTLPLVEERSYGDTRIAIHRGP